MIKCKYKQNIKFLKCSWTGLLQSKWSPNMESWILRASLTLQETQSIHDSIIIPKIEFIF